MGEVIATREAYGRALCEFGADENIMVFDADLTICTMSCYFAQKYPERFFNAGIAECNMAGNRNFIWQGTKEQHLAERQRLSIHLQCLQQEEFTIR